MTLSDSYSLVTLKQVIELTMQGSFNKLLILDGSDVVLTAAVFFRIENFTSRLYYKKQETLVVLENWFRVSQNFIFGFHPYLPQLTLTRLEETFQQ